MAAHVIGYSGEISEQELDSPEFAKYNQGDIIGKFGIERAVQRSADGRRRPAPGDGGQSRAACARCSACKEAMPGQGSAADHRSGPAGGRRTGHGRTARGAVVALDPRTGEVLAMVSRPTFDPNKFAGRIKSADWKEIADNPDHPLLNRAIQAQLAPGSTFKPIMALAGLESGDDRRQVRRALLRRRVASTAVISSCHVKARARRAWRCTRASCSPATSTSTTSATSWASTISPTMPRWPASGTKTGIDLPHEADGRGAVDEVEDAQCTGRSGMRVRPSR